jgi:hypothetical protein
MLARVVGMGVHHVYVSSRLQSRAQIAPGIGPFVSQPT